MNRRLIRRAGTATCLAALATGARAQEPGSLRHPIITAIVVKPDTVWFCGTPHGTDAPAYNFVRQTRTWSERASSRGAPCEPEKVGIVRDTIAVGAGVRIIRVAPPRDSNDLPLGRAYLRVVDSARGRSTDLLRRLDPAVLAKLPKSGSLDQDSISTEVGGVVTDDSTIWIGLRGHFPEGEGLYGGLIRVGRRSGRTDWINDSLIVDRDITGVVDAGRWLLISAVTDAEDGSYGEPGLLRYDKANHRWQAAGDSTLLPDNLIRAMADDRHIVAFATEYGLAVADLRRDSVAATGANLLFRGSTAWFIPAFVGDSMVYALGPSDRAPRTAETEARWVFAQRYAPVGHERFFYQAVSRVPIARMVAGVNYGEDSLAAVLADTSFVPLLTRMLDRRESEGVATLALTRLGMKTPSTVVDPLREKFLAG
jgi:hypothetical protein